MKKSITNALRAGGEKATKSNLKAKAKHIKHRPIKDSKIKAAVEEQIGRDGLSNWKQFLKVKTKEKQSAGGVYHRKTKKPDYKKAQDEKRAETDIWFDDVDPLDIEASQFITKKTTTKASNKKVDHNPIVSNGKETEDQDESLNETVKRDSKAVALDCEMVGVGFEGKTSVLARVSIVNAFGDVLYDQYVKPKEKVIDYRTHVSGIRPENLQNGLSFEKVQQEVSDILDKKILVGHALSHDFKVLMLSHPKKMIRDTANYNPYRKLAKTAFPSLKKLSYIILEKEIQTGEHSSVEDARTTMELYRHCKKDWETGLKSKHIKKANTAEKSTAMLTAKEKHQLFCARRQKNKFKRR